MNIKRVFCYSKKIANQNHNSITFPVVGLIISTVLFIDILVIFQVLLKENMTIPLLISIIIYFGILTYFCIILGLRMRSCIIGWAITEDNRIFRVANNSYAPILAIGSVAMGEAVDKLAKTTNHIGEHMGEAVGAATVFYSFSKKAKFMREPENVAMLVEKQKIAIGIVSEILKVYSVTESKHYFKIICDYKDSMSETIFLNKQLYIEKSYNQLDELVKAINTHKV